MNPEIIKMGEMFRKKREDLHLSLKEVENSTSIRTGFLHAIEEGRIHDFIASIYALGFIKQYANFLGYDVEKVMREFPSAFQIKEENHEFSFGIGTLERGRSVSGGVKWLPNMIWILSIGLSIVVAYYFAKSIGLL